MKKKRVNETDGLMYDRRNGSWKYWGGDYGFRTGFCTGRYGDRDYRESADERSCKGGTERLVIPWPSHR